MKISVKINSYHTSGKVRATASVCLDDSFVIKGIRVIDGANALFVAMPSIFDPRSSYHSESGGYKDICYPCTAEFREALDCAVISAYREGFADFGKTE